MLRRLSLGLLLIMLALGFISGCAGKKTEGDPPAPEAESAVDTEKARMVFSVQEYIGENIAEIPYIEYDGETNPEIESINRSLNQGVRQIYNDFMNAKDEHKWIEILTYPVTSEDYLQAVITYCEYPVYGTDGNLFTINYDKKSKKALILSEVMSELGLSPSEVEKEVAGLFQPEVPSQYISEISITGFLINQVEDGTQIKLLLEIMLENSEAEAWKTFYAYVPDLGELYRLDQAGLSELKATGQTEELPDSFTISADENYKLRVDYFSDTYIKEDYSDGGKVLGYLDVDKADPFYAAVFEYIGGMQLKQTGMSAGNIPSRLGQFKLLSDEADKPLFEVFFYEADYSVFFYGLTQYDTAIYVAHLDEAGFFGLKELIGEIRLSAKDFALEYELSVYELLNTPMLYSGFLMIMGDHYAVADEQVNVINLDRAQMDGLLSSINISARSGEYPSGLGRHLKITDAENSVVAWVYFDTEKANMYIYPAEETIPVALYGTYSISPETLQYAKELLK